MRRLIQILLPVIVLAMAIGLSAKMIKSKPTAKKKPPVERAQLVQVSPVEPSPRAIQFSAHGTVVASRQLDVQPQVSGQLVELHPQLVIGGLIKRDEVIARIDRREYQLTMEERAAAVQDAQARLEVERGQQAIAKQEWSLFNQGKREDASEPSLALRKPQLQIAQVAVDTAKTRQERARLDLARTVIRAPFDAMVRSESVELGQLVSPTSRLATLISTESFWVQVAVPLQLLPELKLPGQGAQAQGSAVTVVQQVGSQRVERQGRLLRLLGELDAVGRMAQVVVEIEDPLHLKPERQGQGLPLLLGSYVEVFFDSGPKETLIEVPRSALQEGDAVHLYQPGPQGGTLARRTVEIAWRSPTTVFVRRGLERGELLITSRVVNPVEGMKLRLESAAKDASRVGAPGADAQPKPQPEAKEAKEAKP